ncbi:MAG: RNA polymerase sigma factor [Candidatus Brocadiia bacterium]
MVEPVLTDASFWEQIKQNNLPDKLYNTAFYLTRSHHDAHDICQETFLIGHRNINNFRGESSLSTYLYQVTINLCNKYHQKKKPGTTEEINNIASTQSSPYENTAVNEKCQVIQMALNELPPEYRQVVILKDMENFSYQEISEILNLSVQTVRTNLDNARNQLRIALKKIIA